MLRPDPELHQDPKLDYTIQDPNLPFADYIKKCKALIENSRQDLSTNADIIIEANSPYELQPKTTHPKHGVLLIHGLFDCPFLVKDIGRMLQKQGCLVRSVLLPGHGTIPGALLSVHYQDWLQTVRYGAASFAGLTDKVSLVGYSTGGSLAAYYAAQDPNITNIILLSPAIKIDSCFDFLSGTLSEVGRYWPRAGWMRITDEIDYARYQSIAYNPIYQVHQLANAIKKSDIAKKIQCPVYIAACEDDKIVSTKNSIAFFQQTSNPKNQMLIYSNHAHEIQDSRIHFRNCRYPEWGIDNFSHLTLPISPDNPHYGKNGDYVYASHIDKTKFNYSAQNQLDEKWSELLYQFNFSSVRSRRLTFNPDFERMADEISQFIFS